MKKFSTALTAFLICAAVFASTTQFDQAREPHEHCLQELACDEELRQDEGGLAWQILVANTNVRWACTICGQKVLRPKNAGRPSPGRCWRNKNGPHSWVRD